MLLDIEKQNMLLGTEKGNTARCKKKYATGCRKKILLGIEKENMLLGAKIW